MSLTGIGVTLKVLRDAFDVATSELADLWDDDNPSTGHCHVAALIIRERHGGQIWRGIALDGWGGEVLHYWNEIGGVLIDVTADQFNIKEPIIEDVTDATLEVLNETTKEKRDLLAERSFGGVA